MPSHSAASEGSLMSIFGSMEDEDEEEEEGGGGGIWNIKRARATEVIFIVDLGCGRRRRNHVENLL